VIIFNPPLSRLEKNILAGCIFFGLVAGYIVGQLVYWS
jgi:hypothetical protein